MKRLFVLFLLCSVSLAQEIKRPQADTDAGNNLSLGCIGTNHSSLPMLNGYDAGGIPTVSSQTVSGTKDVTVFKTRKFASWAPTTATYISLTLNVNSSSTGYSLANPNGTGQACVAYSTNHGATWTSLRCDTTGTGWPQKTQTITLSTSQDLSALAVGVCVQGNKAIGGDVTTIGADNIAIYDIWTVGSFTTQGPGGGATSGLPHRSIITVN